MSGGRKPYAGEAHVSEHGANYFRISIQAYNVAAEVYITRENAEEIRDRLTFLMEGKPERERTPEDYLREVALLLRHPGTLLPSAAMKLALQKAEQGLARVTR